MGTSLGHSAGHYWKISDIDTQDIYVWSVWIALCSFVPSSRWVTSGDGKQLESSDGACFPTVKRIAQVARCSERKVRQAIETLRNAGYVRVFPTYSSTDGGQRSNRYKLYPLGNAPLYFTEREVKTPDNLVTLPLPISTEEDEIIVEK